MPTDIAPDGSVVVGYALNQSLQSETIDAFFPATHMLRQIDPGEDYMLAEDLGSPSYTGPVTDGRFIAWQTRESINGPWQLKYFDVRSGKIVVLATQSDSVDPTGPFTSLMMNDQGTLVWSRVSANPVEEIIEITYLAADNTTTLGYRPPFPPKGLCWPYLLIGNQLFNIQTGNHLPLPELQAGTGFAICFGTTVYTAFHTIRSDVDSVQMKEVPISAQISASWRQGDFIPFITPGGFIGVNNRLFLLFGQPADSVDPPILMIWDRLQKRLVAITAFNDYSANVAIHGDWLVYVSKTGNQTILNLVNTTKLPAHHP